MDDLLTPVTTTYLRSPKDQEPFLTEVNPVKPTPSSSKQSKVSSPDEALEALRNQPDYDCLISVLRFLTRNSKDAGSFRLHVPSPKSAAIIQTLVTEIAPNYWTLLYEGSGEDEEEEGANHQDLELFCQCLRSVTGINALVAHLKALIQESKSGSKETRRPDISLHISIFLDILATVLRGDDAIRRIWTASTSELGTPALKKVQSQSLLSVLTSGRLVSINGEAADILGREEVRSETRWISDGLEVTKWLGRNVASWARTKPEDLELQFCSDLFQRAMSLGYSDHLIKLIIDILLLSNQGQPDTFSIICLSSTVQGRKVLQTLLEHLSEKFLDRLDLDEPAANSTVAAVAGVIYTITKGDELRTNELVKWCTSASGAGLGRGVGIRRAVLAALAQSKDVITSVLEKSLVQFGDELYIRHAAILQQKVHAEILLLSAGYVSRLASMKLAMLLRSGSYLSAISNRIAATQVTARFLGMVVGESLSALVDKNDQKLNFQMEEMDTDEAEKLKSLVKVQDQIGSVDSVLSEVSQQLPRPRPATVPRKPAKKKPKPTPEPISSTKPRAIIEEIDSSDDEDENDLVPMAKHSDPEDSDEDPTVVQRVKTKPPVYVRDLISYFRDSENHDKQKLALETAPILIRRKGNYGTEVSSHADELAGLLVAIQDKFELEKFDDLRLQGMIALVVAQPKHMAPWFARTFFEGDYSLSQRTSVLVTLGLSARELAGFQKSEYQSAAEFASKKLPEKMEKLYLESSQKQTERVPASQLKALPPTALDDITKSLTATFLEPLAAEAADSATGPDALKLESFTTRYKSKAAKKPRVRAIPNTTASLLATSFFSPLTAHFQVAMRSSRPVVLNPALLGLYLQTLGVIIHAAGPSTLSLPQLTAELWDLLLSVRQHVVSELGALKGWLVAMAALLEVNEGDMRRLCETQGREVVETREWVSGVFERTRGEDGGEENNAKMLAAGVLIRLGEAIERYQALLMGDMIGF